MNSQEILELAKGVLITESKALVATAGRLGDAFLQSVSLLAKSNQKVIVCGVGKSGYVAQKIVATLNSVGVQAVFLHPTEGVHGDLGIYQPRDPTILISKSGATQEILQLIPILKRFESPIIAILGNPSGPIAKHADFVLDASIEREADPLGFIPTTSAIVAMAIGDAIASALVKLRQFTAQDFAIFHPSGQLGRSLLLTVGDVMHPLKTVAQALPNDSLKHVVISMTEKPLGATLVIDQNNHLIGIITDGDIRRALQKFDSINDVHASSIMNASPITISPNTSLSDALRIMEERPKQILVLPVVNEGSNCIGLLRLHDIYQSKIG